MRVNAQTPQKTPLYATAGIGYIVLPLSDVDRQTYIENCLRTCTVTIQGGPGRSIYQNVPIAPEVLQMVEFPPDTESFGTPVIWVVDDLQQWPVVVNYLNLSELDQQQIGQRRFRKQIGDSVVEFILDASNSEIDVMVSGSAETPGELNIKVTSPNGDSKVNVSSDAEINVTGAKLVQVASAQKIIASIIDGVDTEEGVEVTLDGDSLSYKTKNGKSTFTVKGNKASFNGGENRGVVNIAQIESLVQALQKDLLIASSGSNLSQWMASEMPKMEDKKLSH